jgi:hypothetical protein
MTYWQSLVSGITKGVTTKPPIPPIEKESTQAPALPWGTKSPGNVIAYESPVPSEISNVDPYEMMPQNGNHFLRYIAHQQMQSIDPFKSGFVRPNAANIMVAVASPQHLATDGNPDIWQKHWELFNSMRKGYSPVQSLR